MLISSWSKTLHATVLPLYMVLVVISHASVAQPTKLRVGIPAYYPLGWKNDNNEIEGLVPHYFDALLNSEDVDPTYVLCAIERCRHLMRTGRLDLSIDRLKPLQFEEMTNLGSIQTLKMQQWALTQHKNRVLGTDYSVAVTTSTKQRLHLEGDLVQEFSTPSSFIRMLIHRRVDAVISFRSTLEMLAAKHSLNPRDFTVSPIMEEKIYFWMSPTSSLSEDSAYYEAKVSSLFSDNRFQDIYDDYIRTNKEQ